MIEKKVNFLSDFPAITTEAWIAKITTDLKGADYNRKLVWHTPEGFDVQPLYRAEDLEGLQSANAAPGQFPYVSGTKSTNEWYVRQDIDASCAKTANAIALDVLSKGIDSLGFELDKKALSADYIATLLEGIVLDAVELNFNISCASAPLLITLLEAYYIDKGCDINNVQGSVNVDPMQDCLLSGDKLTVDEVTQLTKSAIESAAKLPKYKVVAIHAISLNNAGVYTVQELAYALAWGSQYMTLLTDAGLDATEVGKRIRFNFGVGGNYFMEIAKFRAARMLWAMIMKAYKPSCSSAEKMNIHAQTSTFNKTVYDANVNMLRTQTEAMSATLAGVDSLTITPYDKIFQTPDEFSERIARNQQLILKEECHFDKVVDPSGGSYYIENLTNELAEGAWKIFLEIEELGGFYKLLEEGTIRSKVQELAAKRQGDLAVRKEVLLGTNQFPNFNEFSAEKLANAIVPATEQNESALLVERASEKFEQLRLATEAAEKRPKVFMLTIGSLAMRLARAQFACNFFACAGYEVVDNLGFESIEAGVEAAQAADTDIIVLCSSDDEYVTFAPEAFKVIEGKQILVVAGAPKCMDDLKAQGIEHFVNVRTNVLNTLKAFNNTLGIK